VSKVSDVLKKSRKASDSAVAPPKLKAEDWEALLKYSKHTGKLRLHSSKIMQDPGTVHRLLANKLISPDGRLTRQALLKCEAMRRQMRKSLAGRAEDESDPVYPAGPADERKASGISSPSIELSDADWAILMTYDRQTGHLLQYDSGTGRLGQGSLKLLRDTGTLQRLLKNKLIYPGGELTTFGKRECELRDRELQTDTTARKTNHVIQPKTTPQPQAMNLPKENRVSKLEPVSEPKLLIPANTIAFPEKTDGSWKESFDNYSNKRETKEIDKNLISLLDPQCFESEQFKILRTNIFVPVAGKAPRSLLITSVTPGEGKSFVAANLAISIARAIDRHVLLMDCDLRRPTAHSLFGFGRVPGLSDYLADGTSLPTLLQKTKVPKLTLLPAGKPPHNPAELLSSERMADLVNEVSERYGDRFITGLSTI